MVHGSPAGFEAAERAADTPTPARMCACCCKGGMHGGGKRKLGWGWGVGTEQHEAARCFFAPIAFTLLELVGVLSAVHKQLLGHTPSQNAGAA